MLVSSSEVFPQICSISSASTATDPLSGVKDQISKFHKNKVCFVFLTEILHGNNGKMI